MNALTLKIVTPEGVDQTVGCDSVVLWMASDRKGRGEGSIGIRRDHTDAVIALGNGPLEAFSDGNKVFSARTESGFAAVLKNTVTVVASHIETGTPA